MGWVNGLLIQSGYLAGDYIDINSFIPEVQQGYARNSLDISISRSAQGVDDDFINPYIETQFDVSKFFTTDSPDYVDEELASIAVKDENGITGYICTYISKSTGNPSEVNIHTKFKNGSGVILGQADGVARMYIQNTLTYTYFDPPKVYFSISVKLYNDHLMFSMALNMVQVSHYGGGLYCNSTWAGLIQDLTMLEGQWGIQGAIDDETKIISPEFGPASEPGGGYIPGGGTKPNGGQPKKPTFDNTSDKIQIDAPPTLTALTNDLVHAYKVTDSELDLVAEAMYPDYVISASDVKDALIGIWNSIFFSKYVDYLLDLLILPIDVPAPNAVYMKAGGRFLIAANSSDPGSKISTHLITQQYVDFSCGSISIDEYWVNFLDFTGTKIKLFLPYIGYVDIQPEYVIGGTLYVDYRFNICDGSFMCYVRSHSGYSELDESLIGQYAGVAAMHIPLQSSDYSNKVAGLISAIGTVAAGAASGGIAAAGAGATASAVNTLIQKPGSTHANGYNASSSFLSNKTPYLIIERQWGQFSQKYPDEVGVPSNVMCRIGDLTGLVKSQNAHLDSIPCSMEMKEKISSLLADGIIVG